MSEPIFDPQFLSRLRSLFLQLRSRRQLQRQGAQQSLALGHSRQFKDHRPYLPGDDYRQIDWQLYARLDRLYIRQFEAIQEFHLHVILDTSRSMARPHPAKRLAGLRLAAAVAYLGLIQQHQVSLLTLTDRVQRRLPPLKGQGHVHQLLRHLEGLEFGGVSDLPGALGNFRPTRQRRSLVVVVSDLFGASEASAATALGHVAHWPAESHLVQVLHPRERWPEPAGEIELVESETGHRRRLEFDRRDAARYRRRVEAYLETLRHRAAARAIGHHTWDTGRPFETQLLDMLARSRALGGS